MITEQEYNKILFDPLGDSILIELEEAKHNINNIDDLINFLEFAISHNYYTGHYWDNIYNFNNELEEIVLNLNLEPEYEQYITEYADRNGDIFIFNKYEPGNYAEPGSLEADKIKFIISYYERLLTPDEYEDIYVLDKFEYINECYSIPEHLESYINYDKIAYDLSINPGTEELNQDYFIIFEEVDQ